MSTIKVTNINNASASSGGIALDASGHVQVDGLQMPTAGALSNRNLIINGAMQVAQRDTQVTGVTTSGFRTCDRLNFVLGTLGTWTVDQSTNAPTGFSNSFKVTCTTADASPAAADSSFLTYKIEGQDLQHLNFGTSDAQPLILSFWVKSNKTGNASVSFIQADIGARAFTNTYSISAADTWEYKTISIPADTGGQIDNNNGEGFRIDMWLNSGSNYTGGTTQAWGALVNANRNPSNLGVGGAVNDYFQITGLQLEVGEKATPFERRSYGDELARCQRYYYRHAEYLNGSAIGIAAYYQSSRAFVGVPFPTTMRALPTIDASDFTNAFRIFRNGSNDNFAGWANIQEKGYSSVIIETDATLSGTAGQAGWCLTETSPAQLSFNAEL